jgi:hypothetical protein
MKTKATYNPANYNLENIDTLDTQYEVVRDVFQAVYEETENLLADGWQFAGLPDAGYSECLEEYGEIWFKRPGNGPMAEYRILKTHPLHIWNEIAEAQETPPVEFARAWDYYQIDLNEWPETFTPAETAELCRSARDVTGYWPDAGTEEGRFDLLRELGFYKGFDTAFG